MRPGFAFIRIIEFLEKLQFSKKLVIQVGNSSPPGCALAASGMRPRSTLTQSTELKEKVNNFKKRIGIGPLVASRMCFRWHRFAS